MQPNKRIENLKFFKDFFNDGRNEVIVKTIKEICLVGRTVDTPLTGEMLGYRAGRQDVWNEIQKLVNANIEQEQNKLQEIQNGSNGTSS